MDRAYEDDKLSSIFLSVVMLAMIFDAALCEQALVYF